MVLTPVTIVIALLGVLVGYMIQAINTGKFMGVATVPQAWLPYLSLGGGFLSAFVTSIQAAPTPDAGAWFSALLAGLLALGGVVSGINAHQHLTAKP